MTPERRLAFAVLWAAVFDLQKYRFANRRRHQRRYMEAYLWVTSDDLEWEFSFNRLCEAFEVNAEEARGMLLGLNGHAVAPASKTPSHAAAPHGGVSEDIEEAA